MRTEWKVKTFHLNRLVQHHKLCNDLSQPRLRSVGRPNSSLLALGRLRTASPSSLLGHQSVSNETLRQIKTSTLCYYSLLLPISGYLR